MFHINLHEKLLNRAGQLFVFIAFFLVTPEISGEERLKRFSESIKPERLWAIFEIAAACLFIGTILYLQISQGNVFDTIGRQNEITEWHTKPFSYQILISVFWALTPVLLVFTLLFLVGLAGLLSKVLAEANAKSFRRLLFKMGVNCFVIGSIFMFIDA